MNMTWWRNNGSLWRLLFLLFLGQVVSFVLSILAFTASLVASLGVNTPLSLSFFSYLSLTVVYGSIFLYRRQKLLIPWYWYVALGFVDVQGNYLVNKGFDYTSITSVTLLSCFTLVWVIVLTWYFIGTRYSFWQLLGATLCVTGLGLVLLSDAGVAGGVSQECQEILRKVHFFQVHPQTGGSRPILGDMLAILATIFFAMSNVGEEFCVKKTHRVEVLTMLSLFGTIVTVCEIAIVERKTLKFVEWTAEIILAFAGYAIASFLYYTLVPFVLKMSGAMLFNLSVLTSDMWAVVIRIFIYHQQVDWLYFASFGIVVIGLIVYSKPEKDPTPIHTMEDGNSTALFGQYQQLNPDSEES